MGGERGMVWILFGGKLAVWNDTCENSAAIRFEFLFFSKISYIFPCESFDDSENSPPPPPPAIAPHLPPSLEIL